MSDLLSRLNEAKPRFDAQTLRKRAMGGRPLTPEEYAFVQGADPTIDLNDPQLPERAKTAAREALLFALPGGGIAAGGRIAARFGFPIVRKMIEARHAPLLQRFIRLRRQSDVLGRSAKAKAGASGGNPFAGITDVAGASRASAQAEALVPTVAQNLTRERVVRNLTHGAGTMAGGAAGGASATLLGNELRPDDPQSVAANAALGAAGPALNPVGATLARWIGRLVTGIPTMQGQAAAQAFERAVAKARETGRMVRDPKVGPEKGLGLNQADRDDISLDYLLRRFDPQTGVELTGEAGERAAGAIGAMRLPPQLTGGGLGGIAGFLLAPVDAGASAVTGALTGYLVTPWVREKIVSKAMQNPGFRRWIVGELPRATSIHEVATSLTAIAAAEGVREVRDAIETMADNLMQIGEEAADRIMGSGIEITDEVRRELERLRFNPIGEAQGATLPVKPMVPPAPQPQPLPPGSRRMQPDPYAREQGQGLERDLQRLRQQRQRQTPTDEEQNR